MLGLGLGSEIRARAAKVMSHDCSLASDLVKAVARWGGGANHKSQYLKVHFSRGRPLYVA